jgi:pimeloyl-ACP methyl ester carboxylesterase
VKLPTTIVPLMLLLYGLQARVYASQPSPAGQWVGGYELGGTYTPIKAHLEVGTNELTATLDLPLREETGVALKKAGFQSPELHFELQRNAGAIVFDGRLSGDSITGTIQQGGVQGTFHLVRTVAVDPGLLDQYVGDYEVGPDEYVLITRTRFPVNSISFTETGSLRFGQLFPSSAATFFGGKARLVPYPIERQATFVKNEQGEVTGLRWKPAGSPETTSKRVKLYSQEAVTFRNGSVTLAGTLTLPVTAKPHPAVVLIHGSDPNTRFSGALPRLFAQRGIAVLTYDKRGAGASTGNLQAATFDDLAGDASAGVRFLQGCPDIDGKQVGLWAVSQGGWIAPLVATRTPKVAFMILHAGAAVTPRVQGRMELENALALEGYSKDEIREAAAYQALYFDAMRSDAAYEKLQAAYQAARAGGARWVWDPGPRERLQQQWFRLVMDFDPVPILEKVGIPVLAFFGEKDVLVPPSGNAPLMEQALRTGGNPDYLIKVLPGANHRFEESATGANDWAIASRTVRGYYDVMFDWLGKRIRSR